MNRKIQCNKLSGGEIETFQFGYPNPKPARVIGFLFYFNNDPFSPGLNCHSKNLTGGKTLISKKSFSSYPQFYAIGTVVGNIFLYNYYNYSKIFYSDGLG